MSFVDTATSLIDVIVNPACRLRYSFDLIWNCSCKTLLSIHWIHYSCHRKLEGWFLCICLHVEFEAMSCWGQGQAVRRRWCNCHADKSKAWQFFMVVEHNQQSSIAYTASLMILKNSMKSSDTAYHRKCQESWFSTELWEKQCGIDWPEQVQACWSPSLFHRECFCTHSAHKQ